MKLFRRFFSLALIVIGGIGGWEARRIFHPAGPAPAQAAEPSGIPFWALPGESAAKPSTAGLPAAPGGLILVEGVPDIRQSTPYSCGASVLQAVLHYYGIERREDVLMKKLGTSEAEGTHPNAILRVAKELKLRAELREQLGFEDLRQALIKGIPIIVAIQAWTGQTSPTLNWAKTWEDGHYVIVLGLDAANVYVEDPSLLGCRGIIPRREFLDRWHDYEGKPPYDAADRAYIRMGIFIHGRTPAKTAAYCPVE